MNTTMYFRTSLFVSVLSGMALLTSCRGDEGLVPLTTGLIPTISTNFETATVGKAIEFKVANTVTMDSRISLESTNFVSQLSVCAVQGRVAINDFKSPTCYSSAQSDLPSGVGITQGTDHDQWLSSVLTRGQTKTLSASISLTFTSPGTYTVFGRHRAQIGSQSGVNFAGGPITPQPVVITVTP